MKIIEFAHICLYGVFVPMEHPSKFSSMCISTGERKRTRAHSRRKSAEKYTQKKKSAAAFIILNNSKPSFSRCPRTYCI